MALRKVTCPMTTEAEVRCGQRGDGLARNLNLGLSDGLPTLPA